ncbi:MAG: helix-turn-helix transcriptional regulator [Armatimonadota bacterium]
MLLLSTNSGIRAQNGGLFISRGMGSHPRRVISSYELIFVVGGTLHLREGEVPFERSAGQSLLLWPDREHAGTFPYKPDTAFYWVHFGCTASRKDNSVLSVPQTSTVARPDVLTELFRRFLDDQEAGFLSSVSAGHLIALMLHEVARLPALRADASGQAAVLARHAQQHLVTHFADARLSASQIARVLDCHPDYLGRCFRTTYGWTLTEAIHGQRLKRARARLMDSSDAIESIAHECGFPSPAFFRRIFHRSEGISPSAFRRLYARVYINTV